jgi:hypothetical protein
MLRNIKTDCRQNAPSPYPLPQQVGGEGFQAERNSKRKGVPNGKGFQAERNSKRSGIPSEVGIYQVKKCHRIDSLSLKRSLGERVRVRGLSHLQFP